MELVPVSDEWSQEPIGGILTFQKTTGPMAEIALGYGMLRITLQTCDATVFNRGDNSTSVGTVAITGRKFLGDGIHEN